MYMFPNIKSHRVCLRPRTIRWSTTGCSSRWTSWSTLWPSTLSYRCKILIDSTYLSLNKDQFPLCDLQKRVKDEAAEGGFQESGDILKQRHGRMKEIFIYEGSWNKDTVGWRHHLGCWGKDAVGWRRYRGSKQRQSRVKEAEAILKQRHSRVGKTLA